jgi:hypothetical protein
MLMEAMRHSSKKTSAEVYSAIPAPPARWETGAVIHNRLPGLFSKTKKAPQLLQGGTFFSIKGKREWI